MEATAIFRNDPNGPVEWFLEFLPIPAVWTRDAVRVECNHEAVQLLGVAQSGPLEEWAEIVSARLGHGHQDAGALLREALGGRSSEVRGVSLDRPDGRRSSIHLHTYPAMFPDGRLGAVTLFEVGTPQTDGDHADAWLAALAHELSGTVQTMALNVELLKYECATPAARARLDSLQNAVRILRRVVTDYIDVARAAEGKLHCKATLVPLAPVLERAWHAQRQADPEHQLGIRCDPALAAVADETWLDQILRNLLSNAQKYSAPGPLELTAAPAGRRVEIRLKDHGPGIPPELQRTLFRRYARLPSAREGSGVGLWLSRLLARRMGGDLRVESDGTRTTFVVMLPPGTRKRRTGRTGRRAVAPAADGPQNVAYCG